MNVLAADELNILQKKYSTKLNKKSNPMTFLLVSESLDDVSCYYLELFEKMLEKSAAIPVSVYFWTPSSETDISMYRYIRRIDSLGQLDVNGELISTFILDFKNPVLMQDQMQMELRQKLEKVIQLYTENSKGKMIFSSIIPDLDPWKSPYTSLAELELTEILYQSAPGTPAHFLWECENEIRNAGLNIKHYCLRFDNIFGPGIRETKNMNLEWYASKIKENEFCFPDPCTHFSCTYIRDVFLLLFSLYTGANFERTYNVSSYNIDGIDIPITIYKQFPHMMSEFHFAKDSDICRNYAFDRRKICNKSWKPALTFKEALYRSFCDKAGIDYEIEHTNLKYRGSIERVRQLEMEIMREIDRICAENDIHYFLVGGSLLGAIRHQGFIPWDDDLDIGMLRPDYERFRQICPGLLDKKYSYQSYRTEKDSHYIFDKIRLNETYFSTKFSKKFPINNGIFVDILVYDKTSSNPFFQKLHVNMIRLWKQAINVRWVNKPNRKVFYRTTKILLPLMRLVPYCVYHYIFEKLITLFNKTDSNFYIDSVGMNIQKGAFAGECILGQTERVPFEDMMLPVPKGYDRYLRHWYGEHYMGLPPVSTRNSGHNLVQIDLGKYL